MDRPKQSQLPNSKKTLGELTLLELQNYYNKGLFIEAGKLLEYGSYLKGKSEVAEKNKDIDTFTELGKEYDYLNKRMDIVSKQMINARKLLTLFCHVMESI